MVFQLQWAEKVDSLPLTGNDAIDWRRCQPKFDKMAVESGRPLDRDRKMFWPERKRATSWRVFPKTHHTKQFLVDKY